MASAAHAGLRVRLSCREVQTGHPHVQALGATVGGLESLLAFSSFREKEEGDSVTSWTHVEAEVMGLGQAFFMLFHVKAKPRLVKYKVMFFWGFGSLFPDS